MAKFYTLGVTSGTRGVTNYIDVFGLGNVESWEVRFATLRASLTNTLKSVETDATISRSLAIFSINLLDSHDHQVFDEASCAALFQAYNPLGIVQSAGDGGHLSLAKDIVYLIVAHCIVEAHRGDVIVHACKEGHGPLSAVLCPDTVETPRSSLKLPFGLEAKALHATSKVCHDDVNLGICLPDILSKKGTALVVFSSSSARSKERFTATGRDLVFEGLHQGFWPLI